MAATSAVPTITLNNGVEIPQLGFGVFQIPPEQTKDSTLAALQVGYRHIDTAEMYGNEEGVGQAVRESGIDRSEIFVTSKLSNAFHATDDALAAFDGTIEALGIDYVDLFLMHWPMLGDGYVETWKAMETMYEGGKVRAIGVSNFQRHHLNHLLAETTVVPAANQIEIHPYLTQEDMRAFNSQHQIATEAWSPIAEGAVLKDPVVGRIARRIDRQPAQVVLRWHIQRGDIVFPKSVTPKRIEENFALFDFELSGHDVDALSGLDKGEDGRAGPNPDVFDYIP